MKKIPEKDKNPIFSLPTEERIVIVNEALENLKKNSIESKYFEKEFSKELSEEEKFKEMLMKHLTVKMDRDYNYTMDATEIKVSLFFNEDLISSDYVYQY